MLCRKMLENFNKRYTGEQMELLNKATFFDPRFKSLLFLSESERFRTITNIKLEVSDIYSDFSQEATQSQEPPPKKKRRSTSY